MEREFEPEGNEALRLYYDRIRNSERNGSFWLGTTELTFPQNYDIEKYVIYDQDEFKIEKKKGTVVANADRHIGNMEREFWTNEHQPDRYKMFPNRLNIHSIHRGSHPVKWKSPTEWYRSGWLNPLRFTADGDDCHVVDRLIPKWVRDIKNICCFCMSHPFPEDCYTFWTPYERHQRILDLNYTAWLNFTFQLCIGCLQREAYHVDWEQCMAKKNCSFCSVEGHHKALCTSAAHHRSLAKNREILDRKLVDLPTSKWFVPRLMGLDGRISLYMKSMVAEERECVFRADALLRDRYFGFREESVNKVQELLEERLAREQREREALEAEEQRRLEDLEANQSDVPVDRSADIVHNEDADNSERVEEIIHVDRLSKGGCVGWDKEKLDLHVQGVDSAVQYVLEKCSTLKCTRQLDRELAMRTLKAIFDYIAKKLACSRKGCYSRLPASHFCKCGTVHLCFRCVQGRRAEDGRKAQRPGRKCSNCLTTLQIIPEKLDANSTTYLETIKTVLPGIESIRLGIALWCTSGIASPDLSTFKLQVRLPMENLFSQFRCTVCHQTMNSASRAVFKYFDPCGNFVCRTCVIQQQLELLVDREDPLPPPKCSSHMNWLQFNCTKCRGFVKGFGACAGLTALSAVLTYFMDEDTDEDERSINQVYKDKIAAIAEQKQAAEEYNRDVAAAMQEAADRGDLEEEEAEAAWARLMAENEQMDEDEAEQRQLRQAQELSLADYQRLLVEDRQRRADIQEAETNRQLELAEIEDRRLERQAVEAVETERGVHQQPMSNVLGGRRGVPSRLLAEHGVAEDPNALLMAARNIMVEDAARRRNPRQVVDRFNAANYADDGHHEDVVEDEEDNCG